MKPSRADYFLRTIKIEQLWVSILFFVIVVINLLMILNDPLLAVFSIIFYIPVALFGIYFRFKKAAIIYSFITIIYFWVVFWHFKTFSRFDLQKASLVFSEAVSFYLIGYVTYRLRHVIYRAYKEIFDQAVEDSLTGVYNRRYFDEALDWAINEAKRYKSSLALLFIDVDSFKKYNDRFGHPAVDHILCQFADLLLRIIRSADILCRWGGDEFTILLPRTDEKQALSLATRLREKVKKYKFKTPRGRLITNFSISIGISVYPYNAFDAKSLVELADDALYHAKRLKEKIYLKELPLKEK